MQQVDTSGRRWILRRSSPRWARSASIAGGVTPAVAAPVTLNIVDVAGNLALTQDAIDAYVKKHPEQDLEGHVHEGAGAGTAGQAQGHAGRRVAATSTWC